MVRSRSPFVLSALQRDKARKIATQLARREYFGAGFDMHVLMSRQEISSVCKLLALVIPSSWNNLQGPLAECLKHTNVQGTPKVPIRLMKSVRRALLYLAKLQKPAVVKRGRIEDLGALEMLRTAPRKPPIRVTRRNP